MNKAFILLILITCSAIPSFAQDPLLMQAYSNPLVLNPAYTGGSQGNALYNNYRYQWPSFSGAYRTLLITADIPLDKINSGFGLMFEDDRAGELMIKNSYLLSYAYSFNISESVSLRAGIKGGIRNSKLNISKLNFGDPINPRRGFTYETNELISSVLYADFGTGFILSAENFDFGFAIDHITKPNISHSKDGESRYPILSSFHGSYTVGSEKFSLSPYFIFKKQDLFNHLILGTYFNYGKAFGSLAYYNAGGSTHGATVSAGVNLKYVRIGYGYDVMSAFSTLVGSHEIILSALLPSKKERKNLKVAHNPLLSPLHF